MRLAGRRTDTLSAVARAIAGTRWNGFAFFGCDAAPPAEGK